MGKVVGLPAGIALILAALIPHAAAPVARAQTETLPCSTESTVTPMQGHYTGPWHSDGDYHFITSGYDVELKIIIDGTLDLTVTPDGHVTGTASGNVDAPVYDFGKKDVSSGTGTIAGPVTGVLSSSGSLLVISGAIISMHWGTFVGGGYTVDRSIAMPSYTLTGTGADCVSATGTIAEKDFPVQTIIADGAGQMAQVPGVGAATGTWTITSDDATTFHDLSGQVDAFIASANAALSAAPLRPSQVEAQVLAPLHTLTAAIEAHPNSARCLLQRLEAWKLGAVTALYARAQTAKPSDLAAFRDEGDLLRAAALVGEGCSLSDGGAGASLHAAELDAMKHAFSAGAWSDGSLLSREILLARGADTRGELQSAIEEALHARLQSLADPTALLDLARIAYIFGDAPDARSAASKVPATRPLTAHINGHKGKKKKKKPKATPTPRPTAKPAPTPTATAPPKTLEETLLTGVTAIHAQSDATPTFSWSPVSGATRYLVTVYGSDGLPLWLWSGSATSVAFGDTSLDGVAGTANDMWPIAIPSSYTWTVAALDARGRVVGLRLR